jgi:peptidoglycan DL-endopeptidase CwlO
VRWQAAGPGAGRTATVGAIGCAGLLVLGLALVGAGIVGGSMLFAVSQGCSTTGTVVTTAVQPAPSQAGRSSIPAGYLQLYQQVGHAYGVPWTLLAGIGEVESNHGRSTLPGVHSGANAFGAAGPMQIGIGGAAGNTWGGAPVHPASVPVSGVATDFNHDGVASVYEPADAIAGAAKYLLQHGVLSDASAAIFAYNHLTTYVQAVLHWAGLYAGGAFTLTAATPAPQQCLNGTGTVSSQVPNQAVATAIAFARAQIGKPYQWGGTGPDAFDCSGLVMMAYRAAGISIPRTSQQQWLWGPRIPPGHEVPGDLVFFAGSDGTALAPGHVGLVIGHGQMIEAYATGFPIRIAPYGPGGAPGDTNPVGFTRPWGHSGVTLTGQQVSGPPVPPGAAGLGTGTGQPAVAGQRPAGRHRQSAAGRGRG